MALKDALLASSVPDDPWLEGELAAYFPAPLRGFAEALRGHPLRREIIANRIANSVGGAASATSWYLTGDEQMAAAQQAGAAEIAGTGTWVPELPEGMG